MGILYTILIFGVIITIHEFGHFIVAKLCKMKILEFSIGFGPKIYKSKGVFTLRLLPIGGYVALEGEDEDSQDENSFSKKPVWQRMLVIVAGATMNLILGFIIMLGIYSSQPVYNSSTVAEFTQNATTQATGLMVGDKIVKVNKTTILNDRDIVFELFREDDGIVDMKVVRDGKKIDLKGVKFDVSGEGENRTINFDFKVVGVKRNVFTALDYTVKNTVSLARNSWVSIADLFTGTVKFSDLSGPVGVGKVVNQAQKVGIESVLMIAAFISISIGMFNLLPFPALDGGKLVLLVIELITKKAIPKKVEAIINAVGLLLLLGLMVAVTFKDIFFLFRR
ncbi:MAG: M50 family metallopeptidase [Oscillospiraceae bacterium]